MDDLVSARVVVVDDNQLNGQCLSAQLRAQGFDVRNASGLASLFAAIDGESDNVIVLPMGTRDGATLLRVSLDLEPRVKVIVSGLSADQDSEIVACADAGVSGILLRSESFEQLVTLIRGADDGPAQCSPEVSAILLRQVYAASAAPGNGANTQSLTVREREILELLERGLTNQQIASRLSVTLHTVKNHVHSLLSKLGVGSRAEAAALARTMKFNTV